MLHSRNWPAMGPPVRKNCLVDAAKRFAVRYGDQGDGITLCEMIIKRTSCALHERPHLLQPLSRRPIALLSSIVAYKAFRRRTVFFQIDSDISPICAKCVPARVGNELRYDEPELPTILR